LVARGLYRYCRNPMYIGVLSLIAAQALFFASPATVLYAALLFLAFFGGLAAATMPVAAQFYKPTPGLSVWVDAEYKGKSHTFLEDMPDIGATGLGRLISSVRVGPKETWQVCTEPNYGGRCRLLSTSVTNLQTLELNDAIMSVRRATAPAPPAAEPPNPPAAGATLPPATALELYANLSYSGRRLLVRNATPDFREIQFSDRALSLRVPPNTTWEICVNIDYDDCRLVSEDIPDLTAMGFNRIISSARPYVAGRGRGRGRGLSSSSRTQIVLYDGVNFTGRSTTLTDDQPSLAFFSSYTGSIRVQGGEWQLCDRQRFFGNCVAIADDVRDLSRVNLRGPVASIRRQQD